MPGRAALRVLHIVPAMFGAEGGLFGGAERYAMELARHTAAITPTTLATFGDTPRQESMGRLRVRVLGPSWYVRGQRTNPVHPGLLHLIAASDVVHCHQQHVLASSLTALACRCMRRRVFVSELGGGGWDISAYLSTDPWYHGHLHISNYSRAVFGHAGNSRAEIIFGGVDTDKFCPDRSVPRTGAVLFVGRLLPHKGINDLLAAVPADLPVELLGRGYHARYLSDLHQLAAGKRVRFRHDCNDTDLVEAYRAASCVVLPSVYRDMYGQETRIPELLGQTLLESMACGTPVICTKVGGMPEIVEDGITGFVVPPNDPAALREKLLWVRGHPLEAQAMGDAARRRVLEKFTWPAVARRCLTIYAAAGPPGKS
jgi:glycosyltransferase involved in cell wall biosynthesis